jgi:hypothetical protein
LALKNHAIRSAHIDGSWTWILAGKERYLIEVTHERLMNAFYGHFAARNLPPTALMHHELH